MGPGAEPPPAEPPPAEPAPAEPAGEEPGADEGAPSDPLAAAITAAFVSSPVDGAPFRHLRRADFAGVPAARRWYLCMQKPFKLQPAFDALLPPFMSLTAALPPAAVTALVLAGDALVVGDMRTSDGCIALLLALLGGLDLELLCHSTQLLGLLEVALLLVVSAEIVRGATGNFGDGSADGLVGHVYDDGAGAAQPPVALASRCLDHRPKLRRRHAVVARTIACTRLARRSYATNT